MHTKIDPEFYDLFHHLPTETKFSMLWMLTNRGLNVAGVCSVTKPRFEYETGVDWSQFGRACKAFGSDLYLLPSPLQGASEELWRSLQGASEELQRPFEGSCSDSDSGLMPTRYWIRSYVRKQVAQDGPSLAKSNVAKALVRAVCSADSPELLREFLLKYPSLDPLFSSASSENTHSAPSPLQGASKPLARGKRGEESTQRGEERHGEEGFQRESQEPHEPSSPENKKPGAPEDIATAQEVLARLGSLLGRKKNQRATNIEEVHAMKAHVSFEDLSLVEAWFMANADDSKFYPPQTLVSFIQNFQGQVDRARKFFAQNPESMPSESTGKKFGRAEEPLNWREALLEKYPGALTGHWRSWWDVDKELRREFPQFPLHETVVKKNNAAPEPAVRDLTPAEA
jgi:hypothetical protein